MPADSCPRCRRPLATYDDEKAAIGGVDVPDGLCWRGVQSSAESDCQISALRAALATAEAGRDALKADLVAAAGEVRVPIPEPGTDASKMLLANVLMRRDRDEARAVFRDAVHMLAHIARAAGFDPDDPTVEPPAIVARVERLRARADALQARLDAFAAPVEGVDVEAVLRLDREATPGPWDQAWPTCVTTGGTHGDAIADGCEEEDAELIVTYRTAAPALAREVVALRAINAQQRANAEGTNRVLRDQEDEIARLRAALAAEQERDAANARLSAIVEAYQDSTGSQTTAEQLPADIASLAEHEGQQAADCDMYREFMGDLLVAIGADPTAWDALDEQAKAVEHAKALVRSLEDASAEVERLRAAMLTSDAVKP